MNNVIFSYGEMIQPGFVNVYNKSGGIQDIGMVWNTRSEADAVNSRALTTTRSCLIRVTPKNHVYVIEADRFDHDDVTYYMMTNGSPRWGMQTRSLRLRPISLDAATHFKSFNEAKIQLQMLQRAMKLSNYAYWVTNLRIRLVRINDNLDFELVEGIEL